MQRLTVALFCAGMLAVAAAGSVNAANCYVVFDSSNNVVYQDVAPPVDMSDRGDAARAAMRQRGQFLMLMDAPQCPRVIAVSGPAGSAATVEQIVSTMRPYAGNTRSSIASGNTTSSRASTTAP